MTNEELLEKLEEIKELVLILHRIRDRGAREKFKRIIRYELRNLLNY